MNLSALTGYMVQSTSSAGYYDKNDEYNGEVHIRYKIERFLDGYFWVVSLSYRICQRRDGPPVSRSLWEMRKQGAGFKNAKLAG